MNVLIVYETKFGNTKKVAENIAEGMKEASELKIEVLHVKEIDYSKIQDFDALIIGSPTWGGTYTPTIKEFINKLFELSINEKFYAIFDTDNDMRLFGNAVKKLEKSVNKKLPNFKLILPGLRIKVIGLKGPLADGELIKCQTYGKELALKLQQ